MTQVAEAPAAPEQAAAATPMTEEQALQMATQWANEQAARLTERAQKSLADKNGQANGGVAPRIGAPTTYLGGPPYVAFDVVATSPITVAGPGLIYPPSKIITAGSLSFLVAFIYTNPSPGPGWAVPASVQLGLRPWRMTVDLTNLTTGTTSRLVQNGVFGSPAKPITEVVFVLPTPNPGLDPSLIEANVTVYVDIPAQPFAAFATNFYDIDNDPGFPFNPPYNYLPNVPPERAGYRYDLPNRYLIFS